MSANQIDISKLTAYAVIGPDDPNQVRVTKAIAYVVYNPDATPPARRKCSVRVYRRTVFSDS